MRDLVFQPLGLEHAGTTAGDFITQRFAAGHSTRDGTTALMRPFSPSVERDRGRRRAVHDRPPRLRAIPHGRRHGAKGERVLKRESLELLRTPQLRKQSTDDDIGIGWHLRHGRSDPHRVAWRHARRTHPAARDRA